MTSVTSPVHVLERLTVPFPAREIGCRLGQRRGAPEVLDVPRFAECARRAYELCEPRGRYRLLPIAALEADGIVLADGVKVPGGRFAKECAFCGWLWCGAVTVGKAVVEARLALESLADQSVYDAVASEVADAAMDALQRSARQMLVSQGLALAERRYSPGYGDMPLSVQTLFQNYVSLSEMGVELTPEYFMIPEKSVTAWAGVSKIRSQYNDTERVS